MKEFIYTTVYNIGDSAACAKFYNLMKDQIGQEDAQKIKITQIFLKDK